MKISTRLNVGVFIPALTSLVIIGALVFSYQEMGIIHETGDTVRQVRSSITELNHIVFSYALYHEERPKQQFTAEYQQLTLKIAGTRVQTTEQRRLLEAIRQNVITLDDLFFQLVQTHEGNITDGAVGMREAEDRLVGLLMIKSHEADADSAQLRSLVDEGLRISQGRTASLIFAVIVLAAIALTILQMRTRKSISSNLLNLTSGAAIIGSGDLDFKIEATEDDEFGELSRAFNQMTSNLKEVTASKDDLEKEICKRTEAEEELRASNECLQDQTQKLEEEIEERKQAEMELAESEERFLKAFYASPVAQTIAILPEGRWVEVNDSFLRTFGYTRDEVIGSTLAQLNIVDPTERARILQLVAATGSQQHIEMTGRAKNGNPITVLSSNVKITLNGRDHVLSTLSDITERKKAEQKVQELADQWQLTFDSITDPVSIQDKDFNLVRVNKAYADAVRMSEAQLSSRKCYEVMHGSTCHIDGCPHKRTLESGKSSVAEFFEPHLGMYIEASTSPILGSNGEVLGTVHVAKNITERKKADNLLRRERNKLAGLFNAMEDGVAILSSDYKVEYINPAMEALYGPIGGRKCHQYFNDLDEICQWCRNNEVFAGKTIRSDVESKKTGRSFEVTYAPLDNEDGSVSKLTVWHDITERKKSEALKDEFIGMVSHELRTPLTIITGAVHTAMMEGLPPDEREMLLKDAAAGAESLNIILGNLLELTRFQASRLTIAVEPVDVKMAIQDVVERLKGKSSNHQIINLAPEGISIAADKVRVERILHNLIHNAVKYSPQGGDIVITAGKHDGSLVVGVSDQGIGISRADQALLFQPFERLGRFNEGFKGIGLGLVVCRRLVEAHKGRMWVESEEGKGAAFYFSLPENS